MADHRSAEQVEEQHLEMFGPTAGALFHGLYNEVVWLHAKWLEYRKLFAKSEKRIDILNETAGFFFKIVQETLWENVVLQIARLTDPPVQGQFENLTLLRITDTVPPGALREELRSLTRTAVERSQFARVWRNKRLAHTDLMLATDDKASPLPGISRQHVEEVLGSVRKLMNHWYGSVTDSEIAFDHFLAHDDGDALVHHLAIALRWEERHRERLHLGKLLPEDIEPPPTS